MSLTNVLNDLAANFAQSVFAAIRGVPLEEVVAEIAGAGAARKFAGASTEKLRAKPGPKPKAAKAAPVKAAKAQKAPKAAKADGDRLARRSDEDIVAMADLIVRLCAKHPDGLRAEQIRVELNADAKEMPRPLKYALEHNLLRTTGQKRATTYIVKGKPGPKAKTANTTTTKTKGAKRGPKPKNNKLPTLSAEELSAIANAATRDSNSISELAEAVEVEAE